MLEKNTELEKEILILKKDQEIEKRMEIEKFVRQNSEDRENIESKWKIEFDKANVAHKDKEQELLSQLSLANDEIRLLKQESAKNAQNSIIMNSERFMIMSQENEKLKNENARLKRNSKTFEKQIEEMKNEHYQYMNLANEQEDLEAVIELNQKLEQELALKDEEIEEMAQNFNNALTGESKKVQTLLEKSRQNKEKYEEKKGKLLKTIADQEEQIEGLKQRLNNTSPNGSTPSSKRLGDLNFNGFSNTEMTLLRMCQNMVDSASLMECSK